MDVSALFDGSLMKFEFQSFDQRFLVLQHKLEPLDFVLELAVLSYKLSFFIVQVLNLYQMVIMVLYQSLVIFEQLVGLLLKLLYIPFRNMI